MVSFLQFQGIKINKMTTRKTKRKEKQSNLVRHLREMADRNPELERNAAFLCLLRDAEFDEECDYDDN